MGETSQDTPTRPRAETINNCRERGKQYSPGRRPWTVFQTMRSALKICTGRQHCLDSGGFIVYILLYVSVTTMFKEENAVNLGGTRGKGGKRRREK